MEIGRRTLFRTCEITWASKRFAVQGHLERGGFILMNLYSSARPGTKGTPRKKVVSADCNEEVSHLIAWCCPDGLRNQAIALTTGTVSDSGQMTGKPEVIDVTSDSARDRSKSALSVSPNN
jgi:hypothetical protein